LPTFADIDPVLLAWAATNNLQLLTLFKDEEVRSFQLAGADGRAQIWIEQKDGLTVEAWDYRKRRSSFPATPATLARALDEALTLTRQWSGSP
jgi:hypothetical protein